MELEKIIGSLLGSLPDGCVIAFAVGVCIMGFLGMLLYAAKISPHGWLDRILSTVFDLVPYAIKGFLFLLLGLLGIVVVPVVFIARRDSLGWIERLGLVTTFAVSVFTVWTVIAEFIAYCSLERQGNGSLSIYSALDSTPAAKKTTAEKKAASKKTTTKRKTTKKTPTKKEL